MMRSFCVHILLFGLPVMAAAECEGGACGDDDVNLVQLTLRKPVRNLAQHAEQDEISSLLQSQVHAATNANGHDAEEGAVADAVPDVAGAMEGANADAVAGDANAVAGTAEAEEGTNAVASDADAVASTVAAAVSGAADAEEGTDADADAAAGAAEAEEEGEDGVIGQWHDNHFFSSTITQENATWYKIVTDEWQKYGFEDENTRWQHGSQPDAAHPLVDYEVTQAEMQHVTAEEFATMGSVEAKAEAVIHNAAELAGDLPALVPVRQPNTSAEARWGTWFQAAKSAGGSLTAFASYLGISSLADRVLEPCNEGGTNITLGQEGPCSQRPPGLPGDQARGGTWLQAVKSAGGSLTAFASYLASSSLADRVFDPRAANGVGLAVGAVVNLCAQKTVFSPDGGIGATVLGRYMATEAMILGMHQLTFACLLGRRCRIAGALVVAEDDRRLLPVLRSASQLCVFFAVSFPMRKFWVFSAETKL